LRPKNNERRLSRGDVLIGRALERRGRRRLYFGMIMPDRKTPPTVPTTWQRKNIFGVAYPLSEVEEAKAWAVSAIAAGYRPFIFSGQGHAGFLPKEVDLLNPRPAPYAGVATMSDRAGGPWLFTKSKC